MIEEGYQTGNLMELRPRVDPDAEGEVDLNLYVKHILSKHFM